MAKKKKIEIVDLESWADVDRCLREIGELEIVVESLEAEMQIKINDAKEDADRKAQPFLQKVNLLATQIENFADDNKSSIDGKTKELTFGKVGHRQSTKVTYSSAKTKQIIANLKKYGMEDCIVVSDEKVNKEALVLKSDKDIEKVGAKKKIEDNFFYNINREKIMG